MDWARVLTQQNLERLLVGDWFATGELGGLLLTLKVGLSAIVIATFLGAVIGTMRHSQSRAAWIPAAVYIETLRNVPLLILVFWAYFIPPYLGVEPTKFQAVLLALSLFTAAYVAEIVRGGLRSVPEGIAHAARALGMSHWQIKTRILLPIAFHSMIPALSGRYVVAMKNTSLAFLIGLSDLTEVGKQISTRLMTAPVEVYLTLMVIYFVVNSALTSAMRQLESRRIFGKLFCRS